MKQLLYAGLISITFYSYFFDSFQATIGNRIITGKIEEKEAAKNKYDDAVASGHTGFLLEQVAGDLFRASIGNLPSKVEAVIEIEYVCELKIEGSCTRVFIPTCHVPRYSPMGNPSPVPVAAGTAIPYKVTLSATITTSSNISSIVCPGFSEIPISCQNNKATITDVPINERLSNDFLLLISEETPCVPRAWVERDSEDPSSAVVMLSLYPSLDNYRDCNTEIIFIIDQSGSMSGSPINMVASTLTNFLDVLPSECYFNIVGFGSSYYTLFPSSVPVSDMANIVTAKKLLATLKADLGGTDILPPLQQVLRNKPIKDEYARQVFVLTDGGVDNVHAVGELLQQKSSTTRVFAFGIGAGASTDLIKTISSAGRGYHEFIATTQDITVTVKRQLERALQPSLTGTNLKWEQAYPSKVVPLNIPPLFHMSQLLIYAHFSGSSPIKGEVTLFALSPEKKLLSFPLKFEGLLVYLCRIFNIHQRQPMVCPVGYCIDSTQKH